jgi:sterol desaturase/sphingolipid hydroxylase (fatty acid hydroxylase superfamily)
MTPTTHNTADFAPNKAQNIEVNSKKKAKAWHYLPQLPLQVSGYFRRPFSFFAAIKWLFSSWFPLSERLIILAISLLSWAFFHPALEVCTELAPGWIAQIYVRNLVLMLVIAGGLHLYFYSYKKQGDALHYDARSQAQKHKKFTFNLQVKDNMFWSIVSGVTVWSMYEVLMMYAMANGHVPMLRLPEDYVLLALLIFLVPIWETLYFFVIHRFLHWPPLYKSVHYLHHRNTNVAPWAGMSMHPIEHVLFLGSVMVHFFVAANPLLIIFHLQYYTLSAITTHTGFQGFNVGGRMIMALGTFHHQLHHRFFECNYGGLEVPIDQWAGSFHDGTDESHAAFLQRHKAKSLKAKKNRQQSAS